MIAFAPYVIVALVHLVTLAVGWHDGTLATKAMLMPALLFGVLFSIRAVRSRLVVILGLAIVFSWLGDVLLGQPGGAGFLLGLGAFFLAHIAYLVLFLGDLRTARPPKFALVYVVWWIALVLVLAPFLDALVVPVVAYGFVLAATAAAALGTNRLAALGGLAFVLSDTILALKLFYPGFTFWQIDVAIMVPYLLAQGLIAIGALRFVRKAQTLPAT